MFIIAFTGAQSKVCGIGSSTVRARSTSTTWRLAYFCKERGVYMTGVNVKSEIGPLKKVILHRPGNELLNLTPDTLERLLFDDIPFEVALSRATLRADPARRGRRGRLPRGPHGRRREGPGAARQVHRAVDRGGRRPHPEVAQDHRRLPRLRVRRPQGPRREDHDGINLSSSTSTAPTAWTTS